MQNPLHPKPEPLNTPKTLNPYMLSFLILLAVVPHVAPQRRAKVTVGRLGRRLRVLLAKKFGGCFGGIVVVLSFRFWVQLVDVLGLWLSLGTFWGFGLGVWD